MIKQRINRSIEEKAMKHGIMGTEAVNVSLELTSGEIKEFEGLYFDEHYNWEFEGNTLYLSWTEELQ